MSGIRRMVDKLEAFLRQDKSALHVGLYDRGIVLQGILQTGTAFLQKPFTPDNSQAKVREVLEGKT